MTKKNVHMKLKNNVNLHYFIHKKIIKNHT